ncbi:uncharacterized protein LOC143032397 [Oratosquilla oratoria]|uniref:uncharacterized protein LOC143032397 n=1 Tax=Oratosquilla oratoria TaxID=337810 RepID=UPI003F76A830
MAFHNAICFLLPLLLVVTQSLVSAGVKKQAENPAGQSEYPVGQAKNPAEQTDNPAGQQQKSYAGWRVLRLHPEPNELEVLLAHLEALQNVTVWKVLGDVAEPKVDVFVGPDVPLVDVISRKFKDKTEARDDHWRDGSRIQDHEEGGRHRIHKSKDLKEAERSSSENKHFDHWKRRGESTTKPSGHREGGSNGKRLKRKRKMKEKMWRKRSFDFIRFDTMIPDMGSLIHEELLKLMGSQPIKSVVPLTGNEDLDWRGFYRYRSIIRFLQDMMNKFPKRVKTLALGYTVEGRPIYAAVVGWRAKRIARIFKKSKRLRRHQDRLSEEDEAEKREESTRKHEKLKESLKSDLKFLNNIIVIEAGSHAREWITPAVATYLIGRLARESLRFLRRATWIIVPVVNPDGYEYSHTSDRLWRKNRRVNNHTSCQGVDLNRNWDLDWDGSGSSSNPCDETFRGTKAFSEPETRALRDLLLAFEGQIELFVTFHNYGQLILYPWGHKKKASPAWSRLENTARNLASYIKKVGTSDYLVGQSSRLLYRTSGSVQDWVHANGVGLSYTIELPDQGSYGFQVPTSKILPIAIETYKAFRCMTFELGAVNGSKVTNNCTDNFFDEEERRRRRRGGRRKRKGGGRRYTAGVHKRNWEAQRLGRAEKGNYRKIPAGGSAHRNSGYNVRWGDIHRTLAGPW